jgi:hypothetical protein
MASPNKNTQYELFVRDIVESLLHAQGLETADVRHNVQVQGIARPHQIDVYWEYRLGGMLHRVIINCKRYRSAVKVTDVEALAGVLHDMPGVRGLIVTTVGYERGAIDYAKTHQIGLKVVRAPQDGDWEGRLREIETTVRMGVPELKSCDILLDRNSVRANAPERSTVIGNFVQNAQTTQVRDLDAGTVLDMNALWNLAMQENPTEIGADGMGTLTWRNAELEQAEKPTVKIISMTFEWRVRAGETFSICSTSPAHAIIRDAINNTLLFVDPSGRITGDVEDEIGEQSRGSN